LKGVGRVLGDKVDNCIVIGGYESQLVDDVSLRVLGDRGVGTFPERTRCHSGKGCDLSGGRLNEGLKDVVYLRSDP
jgi:hypothetical protein